MKKQAWTTELGKLRDRVGVAPLDPRDEAARCALYRRLVTSTSEYAIFMVDPAGLILTWNEGARRIKHYAEGEVLGRNFSMLYTDADRRAGRPAKNLRDALKYGQTEDLGWRRRKDGSRFWADVMITPVFDEAHKLVGFGKVIRDLTEANHAEAHAREREVDHRAAELKDLFLSLISHELRTPLSTIQGFAELLEDGSAGAMTPQQADYMATIIRAAAGLTKRVNDLIEMTGFHAKALRLDFAPMHFADVVQGAVFALQSQAQAKHLWLANHVSPELPTIEGDARRVGQVLVHLLDNAIKFTPAGGHVDVRAELDDGMIRCEVADTGKGISPEALEHVFTQFNQGDMSATRTEGGLGVGLSIVKALVEAHGGTLNVMSEPGKGTTFWFTLPRVAARPAAIAYDDRPADVPP